jgi:hypothetical protein
LLDHCVDRRLARSFPSHQVMTAAQMGWHRLRNGKLLSAAAGQFDVMLTVDQNIKHEQNLSKLPLAVVVMVSWSIKLADLLAFVPHVEQALTSLKTCSYVEISLPTP